MKMEKKKEVKRKMQNYFEEEKKEEKIDMRELDAITVTNEIEEEEKEQNNKRRRRNRKEKRYEQQKITKQFKNKELEDKFITYIYGKQSMRLHVTQWIFSILNLLFLINDYLSFSEHITTNWTTITVFVVRGISYHFYVFYFALVIPIRIASWIAPKLTTKAIKTHEYIYIYSAVTTCICVGIMSVMTTSASLSSFPIGYVACAYSAFMVSHVRMVGIIIIYLSLALFRIGIAGIWFGFGLERYTPNSPWERIVLSRVIIYELSVFVITTLAFIEAIYIHGYLRRAFIASQKLQEQQAVLEEKKKKSLKLLANILPEHFVDKVTENESRFMQYFQDVTVLFSDLKSFTSFSSTVSAETLIHILNTQFMEFDSLADAYSLEKIKTIGDAYFCIGGIRPMEKQTKPNAVEHFKDHHSLRCVNMGRAMIDHLNQLNQKHGWDFEMRIGIARAPAVVCVLGQHLITFDVMGEAPIQAEEMETTGKPGFIHITEPVADMVKHHVNLEQLDDGTYLVLPEGMIKSPKRKDIHFPTIDVFKDTTSLTDTTTEGGLLTENRYEEYELNVDDVLKEQFWNDQVMKKLVVPQLIRPLLLFKSMNNNVAFYYYVHKQSLAFTRFAMVVVAFMHLFIAGCILGVNYQYALSTSTWIFVGGVSFNLFSTTIYICTSTFWWSSLLFPLVSITTTMSLVIGVLLFPLRDFLAPTINMVVLYLCVVINIFPTIPYLLKVTLGLGFNIFTFIGYMIVVFVTDSFQLNDVVFIVISLFLLTVTFLCSYLLSYLLTKSFMLTIKSKIENDNIVSQQNSNELLIQSAIPLQVVDRLSSETLVFDNIKQGTVLFIYFKGYESFLVKEYKLGMELLNDLFTIMDGYITLLKCHKIKSFGAKYLAVGGIHQRQKTEEECQNWAIAMSLAAVLSMKACQKKIEQLIVDHPKFKNELENITSFMGLDAGPFVAGIVGKSKYLYDVYGDIVNSASRMASTTLPNTIQCTTHFNDLIKDFLDTSFRGEVEVKGKGVMNTHFVNSQLTKERFDMCSSRLDLASTLVSIM